MPIESIPRIMQRIKLASPKDAISVFMIEGHGKNKLNAIYARSVESARMKVELKPFHSSHRCESCGHVETFLANDWIGDFHNHMDLVQVRNFLETVVGASNG
jgi:hypothetical protein